MQACAASASADPRSQMPVARSTLLLQKLPEQQLSVLDPRWQDDVLRYGQKIRLLAHPAAQVNRCAWLSHSTAQMQQEDYIQKIRPQHSTGGRCAWLSHSTAHSTAQESSTAAVYCPAHDLRAASPACMLKLQLSGQVRNGQERVSYGRTRSGKTRFTE